MKIETSEVMQQRAAEAYTGGTILKSTADYEIYKMTPGFMAHLALLLWRDGKDFPSKQSVPRDLLFPVTIDGRRGYLWEESAAMNYRD